MTSENSITPRLVVEEATPTTAPQPSVSTSTEASRGTSGETPTLRDHAWSTTALLLLAFGAIVAFAVYAVAMRVDPPRFHVARDAELRAVYETYLETGVPLAKPAGAGSWYTQLPDPPRQLVPGVWDDDPGAYLVASYVGKLRGDRDPYEALRFAMAVVAALPWLLVPLAVGKLFRRRSAGIASGLAPLAGLLLGQHALVGTDYGLTGKAVSAPVYAIYGLAASWLFLGLVVLLLLTTVRMGSWMAGAVAVASGVAGGLGNLLRSWSGIGLVLAAGVIVGMSVNRRRAAIGVIVAAVGLVCAIGTQSAVMASINRQRSTETGIPASQVPISHGTWHPLYLGLGYEGIYDDYRTRNPFGIRWSDEFGWAKARDIKPDVVLNSADYDAIIRGLYFDELRTHPWSVARTYALKLADTIAQNALLVLFVLAVLVFSLRRTLLRSGVTKAMAVAAPAGLYGLLPPTLVMPLRYYFVELTAALGLLLVAGLGALASVRSRREDLLPGGPSKSFHLPVSTDTGTPPSVTVHPPERTTNGH